MASVRREQRFLAAPAQARADVEAGLVGREHEVGRGVSPSSHVERLGKFPAQNPIERDLLIRIEPMINGWADTDALWPVKDSSVLQCFPWRISEYGVGESSAGHTEPEIRIGPQQTGENPARNPYIPGATASRSVRLVSMKEGLL